MRTVWELLFWITVALIVYVYFGYPTLLWLLSKLKGGPRVLPTEEYQPSVSLIIAAHNEKQVIAQKLENSLVLEYPRGKLEIILVSDGSTDGTADVGRRYAGRGVKLVNLHENLGKAAAQNEAVKHALGEILAFTDAEVFFQSDVLGKLIRHFGDKRVGCVVGQLAYTNEGETGVSEGEGFYWRYESFIRLRESELGNLIMGSGSIMAVRRCLFKQLDPAASEDFVLPMRAAVEGYMTRYEMEAIARLKLFQVGPGAMFTTKVRTIMLDTRSVFLCRAILNPVRYPLHAWGLISHKILRWLVPHFLVALFILNLLLLSYPVYRLTLMLQIMFYASAALGYVREKRGKVPRILSVPFFYCLVNLAALVGVARFLSGKRAGRWEPVR